MNLKRSQGYGVGRAIPLVAVTLVAWGTLPGCGGSDGFTEEGFGTVSGAPASALAQPLSVAALATREPTVAQTESPRISRLALLYQPILIVAKADRFWPVPIATVLALRDGKRLTCLHTRSGCSRGPPSLEQLRRGDSRDYLLYPAPLKSAQREFESVARALGIDETTIRDWIEAPAADPFASAQEYFIYSRNAPHVDPPLPHSLITLQYWFFYPFNYLPVSLRASEKLGVDPDRATRQNRDYHQGDFEHVDVLLERDTLLPRYVYMARHSEEGKTYRWWSPALERRGTHPVIYVGFGGHASYAGCGAQERRLSTRVIGIPLGIRLYDYAICPRPPASKPVAPAGPVFEFGTETPLVALRPDSWACWRGLFGDVPLPNSHGILDQIRRVANGPEAPLRQAENRGRVC